MTIRRERVARVALLVVASILAAAGATVTQFASARIAASPAATSNLSATWSAPGANPQNTRDVGGPIDAATVSRLGVAWTVPITGQSDFGAYVTTPVVVGGVVYTEDLQSNVYAINLRSGKILWTKKYSSLDAGPNGVTVAKGTVFGATDTSAFALRASTGKQLWIKKLIRNTSEGVDVAPGYDDGTVYFSTVPLNAGSLYAGPGQGVVWALDPSTGATRWKWDTVPTNLWSSAHTDINSGGGLWYPPTFDGHGDMYFGTGNPGPLPGTPQYPWGSSRPGPDLYTDSIVKLNAETGKLLWYYQLTPHDLYDRDLQNSPILASPNGQQIVIDGGKAGILVAVNAQTGSVLWRRPVGVHNGHDDDNLLAENGETSQLHMPEVIEPGDLGGIETPLASTGTTVFAAVNDLASEYSGQGFQYLSFPTPVLKGVGELVAVDEATGKIEWDRKLPSSPYGGATVSSNVVFTTLLNGTVDAFNTSTGARIWHAALPSQTNAPVAVVGNTLLTGASYPGPSGNSLVVAYRLGAKGKFPAG